MLTNNLLVLKKTVLGLAIGWTLLIAFLCLITFNDLPTVEVESADKYVHAAFYFVLIMLWGFYVTLKQNEIRIPKIIGIIILAVFYGILIEILQGTLTKTRHADALDVLANTAGSIIALVAFIILKNKKSQNSSL